MKDLLKISLEFSSRVWLKTFPVILFCLIVDPQQLLGQFLDDFSDGDFTTSPVWSGHDSKFLIDQGALRLQAPAVGDFAYLSTSSRSFYNASWEFFVRLDFNPSSGNLARVYVAADQSDLSGPLNGYFVLIGDTPDEISLYRQSGNTRVKIIDGIDGRVNLSASKVKIRVTRDAFGVWELYSDVDTTGVFILEGTVADLTHSVSAHVGVYCIYTSTRSDKFYFDEFAVAGESFIDLVPPDVKSVEPISEHSLLVAFSEELDSVSAVRVSNYHVSQGIGFPTQATLGVDRTTVTLIVDSGLTNGLTYDLQVDSVADLAGNVMGQEVRSFLFFTPVEAVEKDIIVTELFPDPTPSAGLPEAEFIEIFNRSRSPFNLLGWRIGDESIDVALNEWMLLPGEYLIITSLSAKSFYDTIGATMGLPVLPSLNNSSDIIRLVSPEGRTIDSLTYSSSWYRDDEKKDGGWTLELVDPDDECRGSLNWIASSSETGGTPGSQNSVFNTTVDETGPRLLSVSKTGEALMRFEFDEALQKNTPVAGNFFIDPPVVIAGVSFADAERISVDLSLGEDLDSARTYNIKVIAITDCPGNLIQDDNSTFILKLDTLRPEVLSDSIVSPTELQLMFSERVDPKSAQAIPNYSLPGGPDILMVVVETSQRVVTITFDTLFTNGVGNTILIENITDVAGNVMLPEIRSFRYFVPVPATHKDIIITELLPDPTPPVGLPETEFVEIFNRSEKPFDLSGWKLVDENSEAVLPGHIILPGQYRVLCATTRVGQFAAGKALGVVSFPSLSNAGESLKLITSDGLLVDSVHYSSSWYRDDEKKDGGWTLEIVDPDDACRGSLNWVASESDIGGTPGSQNSVYNTAVDVTGPMLLNVSRTSEAVLTFEFDEPLQTSTPVPEDFNIDPGVNIGAVSFADTERTSIALTLDEDLDSAKTYNIGVSNIADCPGNPLQSAHDSFVLKLDTISPKIVSSNILSQKKFQLVFSERLDSVSAEAVANYSLPSGPDILEAVLEADQRLVTITFDTSLSNGVSNTIRIEDIMDRAGNVMLPEILSFRYFAPVPATHRDIIITELLPDPTPPIGLPETEFVEIFNRSEKPFEMMGWKLADENSQAVLPEYIILPGQYLVLCATTRVGQFATGKALGVAGFPSLSNSGELLKLITTDGLVLDSINYSSSWYRNDEKKDGGWTLELVDPYDECRGSLNWIASESDIGGTPGNQNSVYKTGIDVTGPKLVDVVRNSEAVMGLVFDEPLQKNTPVGGNFMINPPVSIAGVSFTNDERTSVDINLGEDLDSAKTYSVKVLDITDCPGNLIQEEYSSYVLKLDTIAPRILFHSVASPVEVQLVFSERLDGGSAEVASNYSLIEGPSVLTAVLQQDRRVVKIHFGEPLSNGVTYAIQIENISDRAGNVMVSEIRSLRYFVPVTAAFKDIVFTELLPDPAPPRALPETEFVEIFNRSAKAFDLAHWKLADRNAEVVLPNHIMLPGEYLVLCSSTRAGQFSQGKALGVSGFPSLSNSGEPLKLIANDGLVLDSVNYSNAWYRDDEKMDGGWSLELIDPENICAESENWSVSEADAGGTPGAINSIRANKPDFTGPALVSVFPSSDSLLILTFNEKLDHNLPAADGFVFEPPVSIRVLDFADGSLRSLRAHLSEKLRGGVAYTIAVSKVYDCAGNEIQGESGSAAFALPEPAIKNDIVINEILFNPRPTGVDFVEVYNQSAKYINLRNWIISNFKDDSVVNAHSISKNDFLFAPGQYLVLTEDGNVLKGEYLQGIEETFFECDLPSFPDDEGSVALVDADTNFIDRFLYSEAYHSVLLKEEEGVSLERISFSVNNDELSNWRSASTTSGYATPGFVNSNSRLEALPEEAIYIEPEVIAPQSGLSDFALIRFSFEKGGYIANVRIVDPQGREIKRIANNEILGTEGFFRWDGDDDNGSQARIGAYMVWVEVFDPAGIVKTYRKRVVIAGVFK